MRTVDFLRSVLESDTIEEEEVFEDSSSLDLVECVRKTKLSKSDVNLIARTLVERFLEVEETPDSFLPRVGQQIGTHDRKAVIVTKVENRKTKNDSDFWVVGIDFGGKHLKSKMVYPRRDGQFKVSWNTGPRKFAFEVVQGSQLREELARNVFNLL